MKLKYAVLADYSASDSGGKHTIVGIFDAVVDVMAVKPVPLPMFYLAAAFHAHASEGTEHKLQLLLRKDAGAEQSVLKKIELPLKFATGGPGQPIKAGLNLQVGGMSVPERGDYAIELVVDGKALGRVALRVMAPPSAPA